MEESEKMVEQIIDAITELFNETRYGRLEKSLKGKGYTIPALTRVNSISHMVPSLGISTIAAPVYSEEYDPYSFSGILSRIMNEGAEAKRTPIKIRFENIWRWITEAKE
jgi:hypothetical protein